MSIILLQHPLSCSRTHYPAPAPIILLPYAHYPAHASTILQFSPTVACLTATSQPRLGGSQPWRFYGAPYHNYETHFVCLCTSSKSSKSDNKSGSKSGSKSDSKSGSKSGSKRGSKSSSKRGSKSSSKSSSKSGSRSGSKSGSRSGSGECLHQMPPHSSPVLQFSSSPVLQFFSSPVLQFSSSPVLQFSSSPVLQFFSSPVLQFSSFSVLQFSSSSVLQFFSSPVLQFSSSTVLQFSSSPVLQFSSSSVLQFSSFSVLQFSSSSLEVQPSCTKILDVCSDFKLNVHPHPAPPPSNLTSVYPSTQARRIPKPPHNLLHPTSVNSSLPTSTHNSFNIFFHFSSFPTLHPTGFHPSINPLPPFPPTPNSSPAPLLPAPLIATAGLRDQSAASWVAH
ncbi:hypothetical protein FHG87_020704 [Trinorchestia longiramus]|nr:hypothetical protein FHG87_020704 [Trinorchestia longiramus]